MATRLLENCNQLLTVLAVPYLLRTHCTTLLLVYIDIIDFVHQVFLIFVNTLKLAKHLQFQLLSASFYLLLQIGYANMKQCVKGVKQKMSTSTFQINIY